VFVALGSIVGGALWQVPSVRRALSAHRGDRDSTPWRGTHLLGAFVGMVGSSVLAGLGGVVFTFYTRSAAVNFGDDGTLLLVLGAVLLGGVSAWGGRGGIACTVLGLLLLLVIDFGLTVGGQSFWLTTLPAVLAILIGVFVGWLLELLGGGSVGRPPLTGRPARLPVPPPPPLADAGVR
jgi:ABC-type glucose/galactose transport system permease subunit